MRGSAATITAPPAGTRRAGVGGNAPGLTWTPQYVAFLAYAFAMVTARFPIGTPAALVGLALLPLQSSRIRFPPVVRWLGVFVLWGVVGYLATDYREIVGSRLSLFLRLLAVALLASNALRTRRQVEFFLVFVLVWYVLYPVRGTFYSYFVLHDTAFGRARNVGLYGNSNDLAALTLLQISAAAALFVGASRRWIRLGALATLGLLPFLVILTQSRGAFLGCVAFIALVVGTHRRKLRASLAVVCVLGIMVMVTPSASWQRFGRMGAFVASVGSDQISGLDTEGSAEGRLTIYKLAGKIILDHPITGVGLGAYGRANSQYAVAAEGDYSQSRGLELVVGQAQGRLDTHSTYLNVLAEAGIPGFLIFLAMVGSVLMYAERVRRRCVAARSPAAGPLGMLEAGLVGFFVAAAVGTYTSLAMPSVQLAVLWCLAEAANRELRAIQPAPARRAAAHW
jgi:O-antigen ligase